MVDWSETPHPLNDLCMEWLVGANIAFPTDLLRSFGGFTRDLDRVGNSLLSSGDVFLEKQMAKAGYSCFYHPDITVRHHVPKSRLNQSWFIRRYYWQGVSDAVMQMLEERLSIRGRLRCAVSEASIVLRSPKRVMKTILPTKNPERFTEKCFALIALGHATGLLGAGRR